MYKASVRAEITYGFRTGRQSGAVFQMRSQKPRSHVAR